MVSATSLTKPYFCEDSLGASFPFTFIVHCKIVSPDELVFGPFYSVTVHLEGVAVAARYATYVCE